jgi:hypothetical protein
MTKTATIQMQKFEVLSGKLFTWFDFENRPVTGERLGHNERLVPAMSDEECIVQTNASLAEMQQTIDQELGQ